MKPTKQQAIQETLAKDAQALAKARAAEELKAVLVPFKEALKRYEEFCAKAEEEIKVREDGGGFSAPLARSLSRKFQADVRVEMNVSPYSSAVTFKVKPSSTTLKKYQSMASGRDVSPDGERDYGPLRAQSIEDVTDEMNRNVDTWVTKEDLQKFVDGFMEAVWSTAGLRFFPHM